MNMAYLGNKAQQYEAKRAHTEKWQLEHKAVADLIQLISPKSVIDIPIGTGRFYSLYEGMDVTGLDLSTDMLDLAAERLEGTFIQHDIREPLPVKADLGVCVRLTGWLNPSDLRLAITNLKEACGHYIIGLRTGELRQKGRLWIHDNSILDELDIVETRWIKPGSYGIYLCR